MTELDPAVTAIVSAHNEGRHAEALPLLQELFARAERESPSLHSPYLMTLYVWELMLAAYPPARPALQALRDGQVDKFLAGYLTFGPEDDPAYADAPWMRRSRFSTIVQINDLLQDDASTATLFAGIDTAAPDQARRYAQRALPALVATGDLARAERYRGDPLLLLGECNTLVSSFPLFPPPRVAPRLAATLMGLMADVHIALAVLDGTGRAEEAAALRSALLAGLDDDATRALAQRDLAAPGAVRRELVAHQMAMDGAIA